MVEVTPFTGGGVEFVVWEVPPLVYLDHWALRLLSSDEAIRSRFLAALFHHGTLAISLMNAVELARNTETDTLAQMRAFLDAVGPRWAPIAMDPIGMIDAERSGVSERSPCFDEGFLRDGQFAALLRDKGPTLAHVVDIARGGRSRKLVEKINARMDCLVSQLRTLRAANQVDPTEIDRKFPKRPFEPDAPTRYIYDGLTRLAVSDGFTLTRNHAVDLFHAIASVRCARFVLLDKHWTEQVRKLQLPPGFVSVYGRKDIERFLDEFQDWPT